MRLTFTLIYILITANSLIAQERFFIHKSQISYEISGSRKIPNHEHTYKLPSTVIGENGHTKYVVSYRNINQIFPYNIINRYDNIIQISHANKYLSRLERDLLISHNIHFLEDSTLVADVNFNGNINEYVTNFLLVGKERADLEPINFLTETNFVSLGSMEGKENFKEDNLLEMVF